MKISKLAIAALAAGTLAFTGCSKKDEKKDEAPKAAENTGAADQAKTDTAGAPDQANADEAKADEGGDTAAAGGDVKITEADMEKAVTMFEALAKAAKDGGGDCDKAAAGMQKVVDDNKEFMAKMNSMKGKDPEAEKLFAEKYQDRIGKVMMGMMGDLQKCQNNEGIKKVFESMK